MKVHISRIDKELPLPVYETDGSVGFDLVARETVEVAPGAITLVPNNIVVSVPEGYMLMLASRSSTPMKRGVQLPNGIGVIDMDYSGPEDEIKTLVYNFTRESHTIKRGDKISQGIFVKVGIAEWEETDASKNPNRGGFGSTGGHNV